MVVIDSSKGFMEIAALPALNREFLTYALDDDALLPSDAGARAIPASAEN